MVIAVLYTSIGIGIGIARGQYYWVLDIGYLSWYHSNPNSNINEMVMRSRKQDILNKKFF